MGGAFGYVSRLLTVNVFKRDDIEAQAMVHYYNHCQRMFGGRYVRECLIFLLRNLYININMHKHIGVCLVGGMSGVC